MNAQQNIDKLNQELIDVNKIMTESFDMLLGREESLNKISEDSGRIKEISGKFKNKTKNLKLAFWFRKYMTPIIIVVLILFFLFMKFFVF